MHALYVLKNSRECIPAPLRTGVPWGPKRMMAESFLQKPPMIIDSVYDASSPVMITEPRGRARTFKLVACSV